MWGQLSRESLVWAVDPDDKSDVCGHFQHMCMCVCSCSVLCRAHNACARYCSFSWDGDVLIASYPPSRDVTLCDSIGVDAVWCGTGRMEASGPDVSGLRGNLARDRVAAEVPAESLQGAEFCRWRARWQRAQFVAKIKRLSSLGSLRPVCCS